MRVLSFPFRVAPDGAFASIPQGSDLQAQQLAVCIVSTVLGERELAPDFGVFDPVGVGVSRAEVTAAVGLAEPDLVVRDVATVVKDGRQSVSVTVAWAEDDSGV